jgi:hypothetical protein
MKEAAPAGGGGLLQPARSGDHNRTRGSHRNSRMAVGLEGQKLKGRLLMHLVMGYIGPSLLAEVTELGGGGLHSKTSCHVLTASWFRNLVSLEGIFSSTPRSR